MNQSKITGETNLAEESLVFAAYQVTNYFKEGKFTQKLEGTLRNFDTAVGAPKNVAAEKNKVADTQTQKPKGVNKRPGPDAITGTPASTGAKKVVNTGSPIVPYTSATVNNATTKRIAQAGASADYKDIDGTEVNNGGRQPPVANKPGSNTISDDAGTKQGLDF